MPRQEPDAIGYYFAQASRLLTRQLELRLKQINMSHTTFMVVRCIMAQKDQPVMIVDIADDLHLDPAFIARAVERGVEQGWLAMDPVPGSRRARVVTLTGKAKAAVPAIIDAGHWTLESALNGLTKEEVAQLRAQLERVVRNLEEAAELYRADSVAQ